MSRLRGTSLRPQRVYSTEPAELARQLVARDRGIDAEFDRRGRETMAKLLVRDVERESVQARLWDCVRVSTADDDIAVLLPATERRDAGAVVGVVVTDASNTVTVRSVTTADVNGSASDSITAVGLTLWLWDGTAWWRCG